MSSTKPTFAPRGANHHMAKYYDIDNPWYQPGSSGSHPMFDKYAKAVSDLRLESLVLPNGWAKHYYNSSGGKIGAGFYQNGNGPGIIADPVYTGNEWFEQAWWWLRAGYGAGWPGGTSPYVDYTESAWYWDEVGITANPYADVINFDHQFKYIAAVLDRTVPDVPHSYVDRYKHTEEGVWGNSGLVCWESWGCIRQDIIWRIARTFAEAEYAGSFHDDIERDACFSTRFWDLAFPPCPGLWDHPTPFPNVGTTGTWCDLKAGGLDHTIGAETHTHNIPSLQSPGGVDIPAAFVGWALWISILMEIHEELMGISNMGNVWAYDADRWYFHNGAFDGDPGEWPAFVAMFKEGGTFWNNVAYDSPEPLVCRVPTEGYSTEHTIYGAHETSPKLRAFHDSVLVEAGIIPNALLKPEHQITGATPDWTDAASLYAKLQQVRPDITDVYGKHLLVRCCGPGFQLVDGLAYWFYPDITEWLCYLAHCSYLGYQNETSHDVFPDYHGFTHGPNGPEQNKDNALFITLGKQVTAWDIANGVTNRNITGYNTLNATYTGSSSTNQLISKISQKVVATFEPYQGANQRVWVAFRALDGSFNIGAGWQLDENRSVEMCLVPTDPEDWDYKRFMWQTEGGIDNGREFIEVINGEIRPSAAMIAAGFDLRNVGFKIPVRYGQQGDDDLPPTWGSFAPGQGDQVEETVEPEAIVLDTNSGVDEATIECELDGEDVTANLTTYSVNFGFRVVLTPIAPLAEGPHQIKWIAADNEENAGDSGIINFEVVADELVPQGLEFFTITNIAWNPITETATVSFAWNMPSGASCHGFMLVEVVGGDSLNEQPGTIGGYSYGEGDAIGNGTVVGILGPTDMETALTERTDNVYEWWLWPFFNQS